MPDARGSYRDRIAAVDARLDEGLDGAERDAAKVEIFALFKGLEQELAELTALRDQVKGLVEKWKQSAASIAPQFSGEKPVVHQDHIGASTFVEKGWSRISLGDYPAAEEALTRALELSPNELQATSLLGWAQMLQEKYDDALLNFHSVLIREPSNALARINIGYICLKKRIFGEAIEHLSRAIRLDNDKKATLYAHFYLGLVYLERDMTEDAITFFHKTIGLGPNLLEAHYQLGRAHWVMGDRDAALQAWRDGHAANRFNPWGRKCGELVRTVEAGEEPSFAA